MDPNNFGMMTPFGAMIGLNEPTEAVEAGFQATAGEPLAEDTEVASQDDVIASMRTVYDPEIPINIYDLGLIIDFHLYPQGNVDIDMTLTSPGCPVAGELPGWVAEAVAGADGIGEVTVTLVFDPPWSPDMMSEDAKLALGIDLE